MLAEAMLAGSVPAAACGYIGERAYLDDLKAAFDRDGETPQYLPAGHPRKAKLLALDDLGSGYGTDWARAELAALIEHRHAEGLATIITSNLSLDELASAIDPRVASRIGEYGTVWVLAGRDLRRSGTLRPAPVFAETPAQRAERQQAETLRELEDAMRERRAGPAGAVAEYMRDKPRRVNGPES